MANRSINFRGIAWGDVPVQINAHINGQQVFSGTVTTIPGAMPNEIPNGYGYDAPVLFSIIDSPFFPTDQEVTAQMTVSVATGAGILLTNTEGNYAFDMSIVPPGPDSLGTADDWQALWMFGDCRSNVKIDGVEQLLDRLPNQEGEWYWPVKVGSTLECIIHSGQVNSFTKPT